MVLLNGRYRSRTVGLAYYRKCQKSTFFYVEHPLNGFRFCHAVLNGTTLQYRCGVLIEQEEDLRSVHQR